MPTSVIEDTASKNLATAEIESKEKTNQSLPSSSIDTSSSATNQVEAEKLRLLLRKRQKKMGLLLQLRLLLSQ